MGTNTLFAPDNGAASLEELKACLCSELSDIQLWNPIQRERSDLMLMPSKDIIIFNHMYG
jgi:hypothetical protein